MKGLTRLLTMAFASAALLAGTVSCYDDSSLAGRIEALESAFAEIERVVNANAQDIVSLLGGDCVTDVSSLDDGGWIVSFLRHEPIAIRGGAPGESAGAPEIGLEQGPEGDWYWVVAGVRTDVVACGHDGGGGVTPLFKVEDGFWHVNLGDGWQRLGKATGEDGVSLFRGVDLGDPLFVTFILADGSGLPVPRSASLSIGGAGDFPEGPVDIAAGTAVCIPVQLPSWLTSSSFSALKAMIDFGEGGPAVDLVTRSSGAAWAVEVQGPSFDPADEGHCLGGASVTVTAPEEAGHTVLLEVTLVLSDGSVQSCARVLRSVEGPLVSFSLENVGSYTADVVCIPSPGCAAYAATIVDDGPEGPYGGDYGRMTSAVLAHFLEAYDRQNPGPYEVEPYLVSRSARTYTEADLVKGTPYSSPSCKGVNLVPGHRYSAVVAALGSDGSGEVFHREFSTLSVRDNSAALTASITLGDVGTGSIDATIEAPGAAKIMHYYYAKAPRSTEPSTADDEVIPMVPVPYVGPVTVSMTEGVFPETVYYVAAVPIAADGGVGEIAWIEVTTPAYSADGTASMTGAFFDDQKYCARLSGHFTFSSDARAVRLISMAGQTFKGIVDPGKGADSTPVPVLNIFMDTHSPMYSEYEISDPLGSALDVDFDIDPLLDSQTREYFWPEGRAVWASVQDGDGKWCRPFNVVALLSEESGSGMYDLSLYLPMKTAEDEASFDSDGVLGITGVDFGEDCRSARVLYCPSGLERVRFYLKELDAFVSAATIPDDEDGIWRSLPLGTVLSGYRFHGDWTDVEASSSSSAGEAVFDVVPGRKYVLLAAGIDHDGAFTEPVNVFAEAFGAEEGIVSYVSGSGAAAMDCLVPFFWEIPRPSSQDIWGGAAAEVAEVIPTADGTVSSTPLKVVVRRNPDVEYAFCLFVSTQEYDGDVLLGKVKNAFLSIDRTKTFGNFAGEDGLGDIYFTRSNIASSYGETIALRTYGGYYTGRTMVIVYVDVDGLFNVSCYIRCIDGNSDLIYF